MPKETAGPAPPHPAWSRCPEDEGRGPAAWLSLRPAEPSCAARCALLPGAGACRSQPASPPSCLLLFPFRHVLNPWRHGSTGGPLCPGRPCSAPRPDLRLHHYCSSSPCAMVMTAVKALPQWPPRGRWPRSLARREARKISRSSVRRLRPATPGYAGRALLRDASRPSRPQL